MLTYKGYRVSIHYKEHAYLVKEMGYERVRSPLT